MRADRVQRVREYLAELTTDDLTGTVDVLDNGPTTVGQCIATVFEEEFLHNRYARRDLVELEAARI